MTMTVLNPASLRRIWLQGQIDVRHINPLIGLALLLALSGIVAVLWWLPQQRTGLVAAQQQLRQEQSRARLAQQQPPSLQLNPNQLRAKQFYEVLGDQGYAEQQLKALFAIAAKHGLTLSQGDYRSTLDRHSGVTSYQIDLPVTGPYASIRLFCEEALRAIPFASLDQISFKRQAVSSASLDAHVVLTLYLTAPDAGEQSTAHEVQP